MILIVDNFTDYYKLSSVKTKHTPKTIMKLLLTTLFAVAISTTFAAANDQQSTGNQSAAKETKAITVKAPFKNHWDANSWEAGSGDNFWKASNKSTNPKKADRSLLTNSTDSKSSKG